MRLRRRIVARRVVCFKRNLRFGMARDIGCSFLLKFFMAD